MKSKFEDVTLKINVEDIVPGFIAKIQRIERHWIADWLEDMAEIAMQGREGNSQKLRGRMRKRAFQDAARMIREFDNAGKGVEERAK